MRIYIIATIAVIIGTVVAGTVHNVQIKDALFVPQKLTIQAGDSVSWFNYDMVTHTATADTNSFDSGHIDQNQTWSHTFNSAANISYKCAIHPDMRASLTVLSGTSSPSHLSPYILLLSIAAFSLYAPLF